MEKLILFDIDGTLSQGGGQNRFNRAINNLHSLGVNSDRDFGGYTDYLILAAILEDEGWEDQQIKSALPTLLEEVDRVHEETFRPDNISIFPGVTDLLSELEKRGSKLGLITGNLKPIAQRKLEALGIWQYFSVGGFGSDPHTKRTDLVELAIKRAGYESHKESVVVIGDTDKDIIAAKESAVGLAVGITNGLRPVEELVNAGADVVLDSFANPQKVCTKIGVTK